jgi:hypothetical protein
MHTPLQNLKDNFESIESWLDKNLERENIIRACCKETSKIPTDKGIYFWFLHPDGYEFLRQFMNVYPLETKYTREVDGTVYDLVYVGTAGTRNNKNGENKGTLRQRLNWHLCKNKTKSSLCSGNSPTMSTLRTTVGGLISNDLLDRETQEKIDVFLCKYFVLMYIQYPGSFLEVKDIVNSHEHTLIQVLRPLLNIKNNPNAEDSSREPNGHITHQIKERKALVISNSKERWCEVNKENNSKKVLTKGNNRNDKKSSNVGELIYTFEMTQNDDIMKNIQGFEDVAQGKYVAKIYDSNNSKNIFNWWIMSGTSRLKEYFSANNDRLPYRGKRSKLIKQWMQNENIESVTVEIHKL